MVEKNKIPGFPVAIFGGWSLFFLFVWLSGRLPLYINPRFSFLPLMGALLSGAMALTLAVRRTPGRRGDGEDGSLAAWLLTPIVIGLLVVPEGVGAFVAGKRGNGAPPPVAEGVFSSTLQAGGEFAPMTLVELQAGSGIPHKVSAEGQISLPTASGSGNAMLTHYVMTCCVADLRPVSLRVHLPTGFKAQDGQWVRVRAEFRRDAQGPWLDAGWVQPISQPTSPYLYP